MKIVSIVAHPMEQSLIYQLWDHASELLKKHGHEVIKINLYSLNFSPLLKPQDPAGVKSVDKQEIEVDVDILFKTIDESQCILIAYPGWWNNMPGLLKTLFDRIPFKTTKTGFPVKPWKNKKAIIITGAGAPFIVRKFIFRNRLLTNVTFILKNLGVSISKVLICDGIPKSSVKKQAAWFNKNSKLINAFSCREK